MEPIISSFVVLWAVIDPIGTIPIYIAVTRGYDEKHKAQIARRAVLIAFGILFFFVAIGEFILNYMGVPLLAFQISGGIILFIFATSMIFGESKPEEELRVVEKEKGHETAVFPLATPSIAGPGAIMAAVLMTDKTSASLTSQATTVVCIASILFIQWILLRKSDHLIRYIGDSGASVISRVMGLILAAVASTNVLSGIKQYFFT